MRKLLINSAIISSIALSGCSAENRIAMPDVSLPDLSIPGVYRIPIQQGNLITQEMVNELKPGMTKRQVRFLLGTPLLVDTFHENRWDYLYTHKRGSKSLLGDAETEQKRLQLHFSNDRLGKIIGDMYPQGEELAKATKEKSRERTITVPADAPRYNDDTGLFEGIWNKVTGKKEPVASKPEEAKQPDAEEPASDQ